MIEAAALIACLLQTAVAPAPQPDPPSIAGEWLVETIDNIDVMPEAPVTLVVSDTSVSGSASCNTYRGELTISGATVKVAALMTTMKSCDGPRMSQERDFLALLRIVSSYELGPRQTLVLRTADGKQMTARRRTSSR
jgi:heat shock protein HslJ